MLAAYLLILPYMPKSVQLTLWFVDAKGMIGLLAGVGDVKLIRAIYRGDWGVRERLDVAMKAMGL
ncbi:hypothetical protein [Sphingomonas sp. CV7422]|uniref:hypothetical protein n=1 Tax=Sphingomonas sp. CV7422 TaxID=3018036 RepID=UPI0022FE5277|nr:hypothetical protein [Sphingomonas sp. CV7422]